MMLLPTQAYLAAGFVALVTLGGLVSYIWDSRRAKAYAEFCLARGFKFEPQKPEGERRFRDVFDDFKRGGRDAWRNTISGEKSGIPFIAFEYEWTEGTPKHSHTEHRCGMIWESDDVSFPKFALGPEGWFSKMGAWFGKQDIDFADSPEFSDRYRLTGLNESSIRELFTREIRQFFAVTPYQQVVGGGRFLIWWFDDTLPSVKHLDEWLEKGDQVRRRFFKP